MRNKSLELSNVYSVTNSKGFVPASEYFDNTVQSNNLSTYKIVEEGMFAYNPSRINVGSIAIQDAEKKVIVSPLYVIFATVKELNPYYLLRYLKSEIGISKIRSKTSGSVRASLRFKDLVGITIPLPSLMEQQAIAFELDALQEVIDGYKAQIADLDALAQSIFLDSFGDPITNPKGWKIEKFGNLGAIARGVSKHRPRNAPELLGGIMPLIQTGDIANAGLFINSYASTYSELGVSQSKIWSKGTLCITIAANIGKTAIMTFDACFPDSVVGFTSDSSKCNVIFVLFCFKTIQKSLEDNAGGTAQKNINLAILNSLKLPLPPIELQTQFASQVEAIEKQKELLGQQLADAEMLMAERMQYYFS